MIDVRDRIPGTGKANRKKITFDDGTIQYAKVDFADDAVETGTPMNRVLFNDLQGFSNCHTVEGADGTITETFTMTGVVRTTVFRADGAILETCTANGGVLQKLTTFNADGSITEVVSA